MGPKVVLDKKIDLLTLRIEQTCGRFKAQYLCKICAVEKEQTCVFSLFLTDLFICTREWTGDGYFSI